MCISYFYYNPSDEVNQKKIVMSGTITDHSRLFNKIAKQIYQRYTGVGIQLGLTYEYLDNELETGEIKLRPGSTKALRMLHLWKESVTEEECTYSMLAAALKSEEYKKCAYEHCYTTGNYMINNLFCACPDGQLYH